MGSQLGSGGGLTVEIPSSKKDSSNGESPAIVAAAAAAAAAAVTVNSQTPKQQCLCSPTTHEGSFKCRLHRSKASPWMMRRSKSTPASAASKKTSGGVASLSPKSG
ncbi:hypothetical protein Ancab_016788 [Ancistrocladus abbreviatus]